MLLWGHFLCLLSYLTVFMIMSLLLNVSKSAIDFRAPQSNLTMQMHLCHFFGRTSLDLYALSKVKYIVVKVIIHI